ncbi:MAG TPA: hypothetical protein VG603_09860, partial [Chitinophagales bacterium]|nr:hypothetical protein [Chitinophagales bacterium]
MHQYTRYARLIFLTVLLMAGGIAHAGNGFVFLADTTKLFYASNNEVYAPDKKQLLYFQQGNIFFNGETDDRQNIFLLATSMNYASDKLEMLYEKDQKQPAYSFMAGRFYQG